PGGPRGPPFPVRRETGNRGPAGMACTPDGAAALGTEVILLRREPRGGDPPGREGQPSPCSRSLTTSATVWPESHDFGYCLVCGAGSRGRRGAPPGVRRSCNALVQAGQGVNAAGVDALHGR